jgi:hypothetical protein
VAVAGGAAIASLLLLAILPNRPGTILGKHVFTLTDSEFQEKNEISSMSVRLDALRRHETTKHFFLVTPTHVAVIVPKRALAPSWALSLPGCGLSMVPSSRYAPRSKYWAAFL